MYVYDDNETYRSGSSVISWAGVEGERKMDFCLSSSHPPTNWIQNLGGVVSQTYCYSQILWFFPFSCHSYPWISFSIFSYPCFCTSKHPHSRFRFQCCGTGFESHLQCPFSASVRTLWLNATLSNNHSSGDIFLVLLRASQPHPPNNTLSN